MNNQILKVKGLRGKKTSSGYYPQHINFSSGVNYAFLFMLTIMSTFYKKTASIIKTNNCCVLLIHTSLALLCHGPAQHLFCSSFCHHAFLTLSLG